jgi:hypothetical protein
LLTYRGGNGSQKAGDGEAARLVLGDSEGGLCRSFGSVNGSGSGGDDG